MTDRPLCYVAGIPTKHGWLTRFLSYIKFAGPDECWEWQRSTDRKGYGQIQVRNAIDGTHNLERAHRIAYEIFVESPGELFCCHRCDNRKCCNPSHIFVGTNTDNVRDMDAKGRRVSVTRCGERHPNAILSDAQVREIKDRLRTGGRGIGQKLAAEFGVSRVTISAIKAGRIRSKS